MLKLAVFACILVLLGSVMEHPRLEAAAPGVASTPLRVGQTRLGNVFVTGEPVTLSVEAGEADRVEWTATDAWGAHADGGGAELAFDRGADEATTIITLTLSQPGHYVVTLVATRKGVRTGEGHTRVALLEPYELTDVDESPFGVMTHFAQSWDPDVLEIFARAGIKHVRDEIYWEHVEKERGRFTFPEKFERYMARLHDRHLTPLTTLSFGNPHYDRVEGVPTWASAPFTPAGFEGYARYATEVLKHYGEPIRAVEIWNEYNGGFAKGPAGGRPEVYAEMLKVAYRAIKAARPDVKVLAGGTIHIPLDWLDRMIESAGIEHMDGISVHPYGYRIPPEIHLERLEALRALIRRHNGGRDKPIWVTEQGWYTMKAGEEGNREPITPFTQACYLVRGWTIFLAAGVEKVFWYLGRDYNEFATMGLVGRPDDPAGRYAPKPALVAYATLIRQLDGLAFAGRDAAGPNVFSYRFTGPGRNVRVLWATRPADVALAATGPLELTDLMGRSLELRPIDGRVHLHLEGAPVYLAGEVGAPEPDATFTVHVPAVVARDEPLAVEVASSPGRVDEWLVAGEPRVERPAAPDAEERWTPVVARRDGRTVYAGTFHTLAVPSLALEPEPRLRDLDTLEVTLANASARRSVRLTRASWTINGETHTQPFAENVGPGATRELALSIEGLVPFTIYDARVELALESGEFLQGKTTLSYNPVPKRSIRVDGDLADWNGLAGIDLAAASWVKLGQQREGPTDLSGEVLLCWDNEALYFAARVEDDVFDQPHTGYNVWRGDNFQIGLSASMPWERGGKVQELGLTLTNEGPQVFRFSGGEKSGLLPNVPLAVRRQGASTIYECAIPWAQIGSELPQQGQLGFGLYLNDGDGADRAGYLRWGDIKRPNKLQPLHLAPAAGP